MKSLLWTCIVALQSVVMAYPVRGEKLRLSLRYARETSKGSGNFQVHQETVSWEARKTAIIVCDMWNQHWCAGATRRVEEMVPVMNAVLREARARGVFILHAPSDTLAFYEGTPQRKRAQSAPAVSAPENIHTWQGHDPTKEPPLPIDDSDGGCDDDPTCPQGSPWTCQHPAIQIAEEDAISDQGAEVYNLLQQRRIDNVIVMGVHTNMCVLGRPFSIRRLVGLGKNVALMRDMTDTMYNSRSAPYVSHFRGTDLIVQHIERYWCPSLTSDQILGGHPFHFREDPDAPRPSDASEREGVVPAEEPETDKEI